MAVSAPAGQFAREPVSQSACHRAGASVAQCASQLVREALESFSPFQGPAVTESVSESLMQRGS